MQYPDGTAIWKKESYKSRANGEITPYLKRRIDRLFMYKPNLSFEQKMAYIFAWLNIEKDSDLDAFREFYGINIHIK